MTGQLDPVGSRPEPLQIGPSIQYVASCITLTSQHPETVVVVFVVVVLLAVAVLARSAAAIVAIVEVFISWLCAVYLKVCKLL